mgnify:FL=1|jgi:hypothetical protein
MYGVHLAHKIGDLVRIRKWHPDGRSEWGLGIVTQRPENKQKSLFIKVYIFKLHREEWIAPAEMDIISNIDE